MKKRIMQVFLGMALLFLYAPVLLLSFYSLTDATMIGQPVHFSFQNFIYLFQAEDLRKMMFGTFFLALLVALLSTCLGTAGAIGAFYAKKKNRRILELMNQIPIVNADVVTGFSICVLLIVFFRMDKETYLPLIIGLTSLSTPFVYLSVMPRLKQMDAQIYEAALDLGCTPRRALGKVILPQLIPGMISGFMLSITLTLDDYFISTYTKPAAFDTISTYVVNATKGAQTQVKTALWALSALIFVVVTLIVVYLYRSGAYEEGERI